MEAFITHYLLNKRQKCENPTILFVSQLLAIINKENMLFRPAAGIWGSES